MSRPFSPPAPGFGHARVRAAPIAPGQLRQPIAVVLAVSSARQAATPTARLANALAAAVAVDGGAVRRSLFSQPRRASRSELIATASFAPLRAASADGPAICDEASRVNGAFTNWFQPLVKVAGLEQMPDDSIPSPAGCPLERI